MKNRTQESSSQPYTPIHTHTPPPPRTVPELVNIEQQKAACPFAVLLAEMGWK